MDSLTFKLNDWQKIFWCGLKRFYNEYFSYQASALAYVTLLSLIPLLSIVVYLISFFSIFSDFIAITNHYVFTNFIPTSGNIIGTYINKFTLQAAKLPKISLIFSLITSIMMILTIEQAFNEIWRVRQKARNILTTLLSWFVLLLTPLFIGFSSFINNYFISIIPFNYLQTLLISVSSFFINAIIFSIVYTVVPNKSIPFSNGFFGGVSAALLFEAAKRLFIFFIVYSKSYEFIYGAIAIIPIFLLWIYVSWCIVLLGAIFSHQLYVSNKA